MRNRTCTPRRAHSIMRCIASWPNGIVAENIGADVQSSAGARHGGEQRRGGFVAILMQADRGGRARRQAETLDQILGPVLAVRA